ncbi:MAG: ABC transporter substrate-binding protein [Ardenticatenaceae bacterium]|nr:ABC transporter substrate-binding protein [Ardenticatenaceae bacterium]
MWLAVGTMLVAACAAQGRPATSGNAPIKIGVVMDQTGSASYYSKESEKGVRLAVERINGAGGVDGRMLEMVVEDDQNNPAQSAQKVRKLASDKDIVAVLSVSGSASALQNQVAAQEEKIPEIAPTNIANSLTKEFRSYFFRLGAADAHYVDVIMSTAADQFKKVAIIGDNTQTGLATRDSWAQSLRERGVEVVTVEQIDTGATDATAQVLNMKNAGAELVLLTGQGAPELALITRTIRQQNWDVAIMGGLTIGGAPAFLDLAKEAANGILFTDLVDDDKAALQEFKKNFKAKYGEDQTATANATLSYDAVYLLADAIEAGGATREGIRGALEKITGWDKGVSGRADSTADFGSNDHQGYDSSAVVIRTFKDQQPAKYK